MTMRRSPKATAHSHRYLDVRGLRLTARRGRRDPDPDFAPVPAALAELPERVDEADSGFFALGLSPPAGLEVPAAVVPAEAR